MADIPDEMVEKAAHAHANIDGYDWDQVSSFWQGRYRKFARAILPAALDGRTVVDLPDPNGHGDYPTAYATVWPMLDGRVSWGNGSLSPALARSFGLSLLAAANDAERRLASESSGDGAQHA